VDNCSWHHTTEAGLAARPLVAVLCAAVAGWALWLPLVAEMCTALVPAVPEGPDAALISAALACTSASFAARAASGPVPWEQLAGLLAGPARGGSRPDMTKAAPFRSHHISL